MTIVNQGPVSEAGEPTDSAERRRARKRLETQRKFRGDLAAYLVINALLILAWLATGAGYFWPGWVLAGWGGLLFLDAWNVLYRRPITEADIDAELRRRSARS